MASNPSWSQIAAGVTKTNPSYTAVNARRTLIRPEPVQATSSPKQSMKIDWPPAVREYVSLAFSVEKAPPGISKAEIATKLRTLITEAAESDLLGVIDWSSHPLPQDIILQERAAAQQANSIAFLNNTGPMSASKKRKSEPDIEMTDAASSSPPPWRLQKSSGNLADRMSYPDKTATAEKRQKKADQFRAAAASSKLGDLEKRRQRFEASHIGGAPSPYISSSRDDSPMPDANDGPVVGTNQKLEKNYFRLTAPPKPETVRPLPILKQVLDMLIKKWKDEHNYGYICDQFKSLRQDLTVQHIKNEFTVRVYEAHARIALEKGDVGEYNQCQTQLRALYKQKLGGCPGEFTAYRILYFIYTCNRTGMNDVLADLTSQDKENSAVKHALQTRAALATGNFHKFFRLFNEAPNMGAYLMDMFVDRERLAAMASMCRAYKPDIKVDFLAEELGFVDDAQCAQFLCDHGGETLLEQKPDGVRFSSGKAGNVFDIAKQQAFRGVDIKGQI